MSASEAILAPSLCTGKGERADALTAGLAVTADNSLCTTATCAQRARPKALVPHRQASGSQLQSFRRALLAGDLPDKLGNTDSRQPSNHPSPTDLGLM